MQRHFFRCKQIHPPDAGPSPASLQREKQSKEHPRVLPPGQHCPKALPTKTGQRVLLHVDTKLPDFLNARQTTPSRQSPVPKPWLEAFVEFLCRTLTVPISRGTLPTKQRQSEQTPQSEHLLPYARRWSQHRV